MKKLILFAALLFTILQAIAQKTDTNKPIKNTVNYPSFGNYLSQDAITLANKLIKKVSSCKTISHLSEQKWGNIGDITDYTLDKGQCIFKLQPADTIIGSYYCFKPVGYSLLYNGITSSNINWLDSTDVVTDLVTYPREKKYVDSKMLYNNSVMHIYNLISKTIKNAPQTIMLLPDTTINEVTCNRILLVEHQGVGENKKYYMHREIAINPATNLPVHSISISKSPYGTQLIECSLLDYRINDPLITDDVFAGVKVPAYIKSRSYAPETEARGPSPLQPNHIAPDWQLPLVMGGNISLAQQKGKVVLLEFSGVHCGFCLLSVPILNEIHAKFNSSDFSLVSVYSDEALEKLKKYQARYNIKYNLIYNGKDEQKAQNILKKYGASGIPHFVLIDKKGMISNVWVGYEDNIGKEISGEISKLIY